VKATKLKALQRRLQEKRKELISGVRTRSATSLQAGDDRIQDIADQAASAYTKEFLLSLGDAERRLLRQVDAALDKMRQNTYGQCEKCGEEISEKRLDALPFARYCIACQEEEESR
jgi:DnaK suppressor protein